MMWRAIGGFRHADECVAPQGFLRGLRNADLRKWTGSCKLIPCCRSASVRFTPDCEVGEWWWFENSRAYLYYFFIVNDCQFVAGHADAWCRGIGQTAARFLCDAPFLIRRSSIFLDESHMLAFRISFFVEGSILAQDERWRRA